MRAVGGVAVFLLGAVTVLDVAAHPGGLDRQGGHRALNGYHCHKQEKGCGSGTRERTIPRPTVGRRIGDQDCADFANSCEAQKFFESQWPGDPHRLDRDNDGLACEWNPKVRCE
jgi:hypothetical protein